MNCELVITTTTSIVSFPMTAVLISRDSMVVVHGGSTTNTKAGLHAFSLTCTLVLDHSHARTHQTMGNHGKYKNDSKELGACHY